MKFICNDVFVTEFSTYNNNYNNNNNNNKNKIIIIIKII